jgi:hypothetical protein
VTRSVFIALIGFAVAAVAAILFLRQETGEPARVVVPETPVPVVEPVIEPVFDVVRIGERGDAVFAGRATPRAEVRLLDGGREIGRVAADERGEWVFVPDLPLEEGARLLSLEAVHRSAETVILSVRPGEPPIALKLGVPTRLLQGPAAADGAGALSIDLADHDDRGGLAISGRAEPGAIVLIYLDGRFVGRDRADAGGLWTVQGRAPLKGTNHLLRADRVNDRGKVLARVEVPYDAAMDAVEPGSVVVRPGDGVWRIARHMEGGGPAFSVVYRAGKDRLRDPDRIYSGQMFTVPAR